MTAPVTDPGQPDATVDQLDRLAAGIDDNARDERLLARRIRAIGAGRAKGRSWSDILSREPRPKSLDLVARILARLAQASSGLRRLLATGLRDEGVGIAAIAQRFGVSRQRVSALLARRDA